MAMPGLLRGAFCGLMVAGCAIAARGTSDDPFPDLSRNLDPNDAIKIVFAVYGGVENAQAHYVNVTDKVAGLLQKSANGFPVTEEVVLDKPGTKESQSLIIIYNYKERRYLYNMPEEQSTINLDKLKHAARMHPSHEVAVPEPGTPDSNFRVVFAAYGVDDVFWDVSYLVKNLILRPKGFFAHEDVMGGDPHFGVRKAIIIVFDDQSGRHFYTQVNDGPQISADVLLDSTKPNGG